MAHNNRILGESYTEAQSVHPGSFTAIQDFTINPQPLHTLYGGAHLFKHDTFTKLQRLIEHYQTTYLKSPESVEILLTAVDGPDSELPEKELSDEIFDFVRKKTKTQPIEDYRIDFEDGYGYHSDADETATAINAATEAAAAFLEGALPSAFGFRVKSFSGSSRKRALDTLDIFLSEFLDHSAGKLPENFYITLPKVETIEEIDSFNETLAEFEFRAGIKKESLKTELMIEEPGLLHTKNGTSQLPQILAAAGERCKGLHIGIYDYLSALQIPAAFQTYTHPLADDLRTRLVIGTQASTINIVDGVTNILPVELHRKPQLTADEVDENMASVYDGWLAHIRNVTHSLKFGINQGWDIHPAQMIARYIAVYRHLLAAKDDSLERMQRFMAIATRPNQSGGVFDDAATVRGLLVYLKRALSLGIITEEELQATGLTKEQLLSSKIDLDKRQ
jgi:citrate lyase beta subunit